MRKKVVVVFLASLLAFSTSACAVLKYADGGVFLKLMETVKNDGESEVDTGETPETLPETFEESETDSDIDIVQETEEETSSQSEAESEAESEVASETETESESDPEERESEVATEDIVAQRVAFVNAENAYVPLNVEANAPDYTIASDLSNIENMDQFTNLTENQKAMIAENGFVVVPTDKEQLFYIYEDNTYKTIPSFITTDSVLQLYHIYYDYALRNVETAYFYDDAKVMTKELLQDLQREYNKAENKQMKEILKKDLVYFAVAAKLLEEDLPGGLDKDILALAEEEYNLCMQAGGFTVSPLFGCQMDYSQFTVRGHYTRSDELEKYFRAFIWFGIAPFSLYDNDGKRVDDNALCALTIAAALDNSPKAMNSWEKIYSTTSFMVGNSDDVTPVQLADLSKELFGKLPKTDKWPNKLDEIYENLDRLPQAQIVSKQKQAEKGLQMRFMGQRYIPDSEILQNLSDPDYRPYPTGLDVMAVYGSEQAEKLLEEIYQPTVVWPEYANKYADLANKFRSQTIEEQTSNVYTTWLFSLKELGTTKGDGYPLFMKNEAWRNKSLTTALGSWAELRHDTILYGKQSGAECGGGEEPPQVMSYVEPDPEFFHRLSWLTETTRQGLESRGLLDSSMNYKTDSILRLLDFLTTCAEKELRGEDLSAEERYSLLVYGGTLEYISSEIADADGWYCIESDTDRNMAVIADVHTTLSGYLEEGVGSACEIYVAIPQNGKVYLSRGAVFDYYEFVSPVRMQDETWQSMLKEDGAPERVPYANTFLNEEEIESVPTPDTPYSTGC